VFPSPIFSIYFCARAFQLRIDMPLIRGATYVRIGKTAGGRILEVGYDKLSEGERFVFHAMDARASGVPPPSY
jgi:hypothetical protein